MAKKIKVAINGFGRIGRQAFKVAQKNKNIEIVAINDLADTKTLAHLLKYDTAYPDVDFTVGFDEYHLIINKKKINIFAQKDPTQLPWKKFKVDVVIESTGVFRTKELVAQHLTAGARAVVLSAPPKGEGIATFVRGANCGTYKKTKPAIIDNASCTTNSVVPVMDVLDKVFGIEKAMLTTIHSYTADQRLQDAPHKDLRRARAAAQNMIPTTTGAAIATTKVIPSLEHKFDGISVRVPTITVSLTDFTMLLKRDVTIEEVNQALVSASKKQYKGIMDCTDEPLVSSDFIGNPYSSIVDLGMTKVVDGNLLKIVAWYDNEWGYANRLVEMVEIVGRVK